MKTKEIKFKGPHDLDSLRGNLLGIINDLQSIYDSAPNEVADHLRIEFDICDMFGSTYEIVYDQEKSPEEIHLERKREERRQLIIDAERKAREEIRALYPEITEV